MKSKIIGLILLAALCGSLNVTDAAACKVLVVFSHTQEFYWVKEMRQGIDKALTGQCELRYVTLDVDVNPAGLEAKSAEAFAAYQEFQPDGVLAADDPAQIGFVVPYLKDKVKTPVMFIGIFHDPAEYGYPATNVSGVRQRAYFKESTTFLQQLVPTVKTVSFLVKDNQATRTAGPVFIKDVESIAVPVIDPVYSDDEATLISAAESLKGKVDAIFLDPGFGAELLKKINAAFGKPTYSGWRSAIVDGALCAVIDTSDELGTRAAEMLLKAIQGTPITDLPIAVNEFGRRVLNVNTLKSLSLEPSRRLLAGVELIK